MLTNSSHASSCHGIFRALYVPDVAISALALLETQRDVRGGKVPETPRQRERPGSPGDFRTAPSKKIPTISYSPCFFPLTSTLLFGLFGSALHRNICFLSPVSHPRPPLFSPCPRVVSATSILAAVLQKFVEGLRQWSSACS